jgi:hypothetical protein
LSDTLLIITKTGNRPFLSGKAKFSIMGKIDGIK